MENIDLWECKKSEVLYGIKAAIFEIMSDEEFYAFCDEIGDVTINEFNAEFNKRFKCHNNQGSLNEYLSTFEALTPSCLK